MLPAATVTPSKSSASKLSASKISSDKPPESLRKSPGRVPSRTASAQTPGKQKQVLAVTISKKKAPKQLKSMLGCYPAPPSIVPPPKFGPDCVPPAVARQVDEYFENRKKPAVAKQPVGLKIVEHEAEDDYSLSLPQPPSRFAGSNIRDDVHPQSSILQNPQRIVADGPFAVNEPVKPLFVNFEFDSIEPLRLQKHQTSNETRKTMKDLRLLVQASLRSRNIKDEATAYFNIGLLEEQEGHLKKANNFYSKYLSTLGADADPLVFNRIAVNLQLLGSFEEAIEWNLRHLSFSRSLFETIAANCNIALVYKQIGENTKSIEFYKAALETAVEMDEPEESPFYSQIEKIIKSLKDQIELAECQKKMTDLGSLEIATHSYGDRIVRNDINRRLVDAQEEYFDNQAKISVDQKDLATAYGSLISSGQLNCALGDFERSENYYIKALDVANQIGSTDLVINAKVALGIVRGNKQMKKSGLFDVGSFADPQILFD